MKSLSGDQKQKLFILLGFVGFLVVAGFFALSPKGEDESAAPVAPLTTSAQTAPGVPAAAPPRATPVTAPQPAATPKKIVKVIVPTVPAPARASLVPHRPDPFAPVPVPTLPPAPLPTPVPPPIFIPAPDGVRLPSPAPAGAPPSTVLVGLPSPRVSRYSPLPGPRWVVTSAPQGAGGALAGRSTNKRLSGVIIGDSVRALLEIETEGAGGEGGEGGAGGAQSQVITRVVQPGDEVDGIRILRINREFENGRPVTRMYIREGDQERYVDLRPAPSPPAGGGEGFEGGSSGGSGRGSFGGTPPGGSSSGFGSGSSSGSGGGIRPVFPGRRPTQ